MARNGVTMVCRSCGYQSAKPYGRCPQCGTWDSFEAVTAEPVRGRGKRGAAELVALAEVESAGERRIPSGIGELDRVLGGGWVPGAAVLLGGEPGVGKSTLLLQAASVLAGRGQSVVYVAGEESVAQVRLRADRLGGPGAVQVTRSTDLNELVALIEETAPGLVAVDSIQSIDAGLGGSPGSVVQVREATARLVEAAKTAGSVLALVGHVTKSGAIAGPKVIEHAVDVVAQLDGAGSFRLLRGLKNRFGPTDEVGVFEMTAAGLAEVDDPSQALLGERVNAPGSVLVATLEGVRPVLVEVQALATKAVYGVARRVVNGLDSRRAEMILAVLERRLELPLGSMDVHLNVAGGLRLDDPGADLAVAMAVLSTVEGVTLDAQIAFFGEVGLAGEVRRVAATAARVAEARRAGIRRILGPAGPESVRTVLEAWELARAGFERRA